MLGKIQLKQISIISKFSHKDNRKYTLQSELGITRPIRSFCSGLGAALEHLLPTSWLTVAFARRFLNKNEERHIVNEKDLLEVVCFVRYLE